MSFIKIIKGAGALYATESARHERLVYASVESLERALDGTKEAFRNYFFAMYHCTPDEDAGINRLRAQLREENPSDVVAVGDYFVLWGASAFQALSWFYTALTKADSLPEDFRDYAAIRLVEIVRKHETSQRLTIPIQLSEGQLAKDDKLNFYACLALSNKQIFQDSG